MKRRIEQLINGRFEYQVPKLVLSDEILTVHTKTGENYRGELTIKAEDGRRIKGMVMSSDRRLLLAREKFSGTVVNIPYGIDVKGLKPEEKAEYRITISSNLGEYQIPVQVVVENEKILSAHGEIKNLDDFVRLVMEDDREAFCLYTSQQFEQLLQGEDEKYKTLYRGYSQNPVTYQHLEEFLVAAGKKEPVQIQLEETERMLGNVPYTMKEKLQINKENWGYLQIQVEVRGDFLSVEKKVITQDDFIGSVYQLEYLIKKDQLGKGKQYGQICLRTVYGELVYNVTVSSESGYDGNKKCLEKEGIFKIVEAYERYRLGEILMDQWKETTLNELADMKELGCYYPSHRLIEAFLAYKTGDGEEMCRLLESLKMENFTEEQLDEEAVFLYLSICAEIVPKVREKQYRARLRNLYQMNPYSRILMEITFLTDPEYQTSHAKQLYVMEKVYEMGCRSPFLYLDAYELIRQDERNLKKLSPFMTQVLYYLAKHGKLTKEMSFRIGHLCEFEKNFQQILYKLLSRCYEEYPSPDLLGHICKYIMKGRPGSREYFKWYELAVKYDVRITGIYEYYIRTLPDNYRQVLPQVIRMYFMYNNTLSSGRKAAVYANVIRNKTVDKATYQNYKKKMEEFAAESMEKGRISEDYAVIYQECVENLNTRAEGEQMAKLMYSYRLYCDDPKVRNIVVYHKELEKEEVYPCCDGVAYIQLYSEKGQIFFEDEQKRRYTATVEYNLQKLLDDKVYQSQCMIHEVTYPGFLLAVCGDQDKIGEVRISNLDCFQNIVKMKEFTKEYRYKICGCILNYYAEHADDSTLEKYLQSMDYLTFAQVDKVLLINLFIKKGMYERAFSVICEYGYEGVETEKLMLMTSRLIQQIEFMEREELVYLARYVYEQGKYDEVILTYLSDNLLGSVEQMEGLWEHMEGFSLDTYALEEEILLLSMFGRVTLKQGHRILKDYISQRGKSQIILAYLCFESYDYFLGEKEKDDFVFDCLRTCYQQGWEVDRVCMLALLKNYASREELTEQQKELTMKMLEVCRENGLCFGFFADFPSCVARPYQLDDKVYIEEEFPAHAKVTIHYRVGEDGEEKPEYKSEPVKNMYQGKFVKEFLLFSGESLQYYFTVEDRGTIRRTEEKTLAVEETGRKYKTRYHLINQIRESCISGRKDETEEAMMEYLRREYVADRLFPLIR